MRPVVRQRRRWSATVVGVFVFLVGSCAGPNESARSAGRGDGLTVGKSKTTTQDDLIVDTDSATRYRLVDGDTIEDVGTGIRRKITAKELRGIEFDNTSPEEVLRIVAATSAQGDFRDDLRNGIGPRPVRLIAEEIGVDAVVTPVGLDRNRAIAVPRRADITGWWSGGYAPGEIGPTVIVGHYDSKTAEGIFSRLKDSEEKDTIRISDTDGSLFYYQVVKVEHLKKTKFPTERVYGETETSTLRLITCGGKFDRKAGHYLENTIVYADLQSVIPGPGRNRADREDQNSTTRAFEPRRGPDVDWTASDTTVARLTESTPAPTLLPPPLASSTVTSSTVTPPVTPTTPVGGTTPRPDVSSSLASGAPSSTTAGLATTTTALLVPTTTSTKPAPASTTSLPTSTTPTTGETTTTAAPNPLPLLTSTSTSVSPATIVGAAVTVPSAPSQGAVAVASTPPTVVHGEGSTP